MKKFLSGLVVVSLVLVSSQANAYKKSATQGKLEKGDRLFVAEMVKAIFNFDYSVEGAFVEQVHVIDRASNSNVQAFQEMLKFRRGLYEKMLESLRPKRGEPNAAVEKYENIIKSLAAAEEAVQENSQLFEKLLEPANFITSPTEVWESADIKGAQSLVFEGSGYARYDLNSVDVAELMSKASVRNILYLLGTPEVRDAMNFSFAFKIFPEPMRFLNLSTDVSTLSKSEYLKAILVERLALLVMAKDMFPSLTPNNDRVQEVELMKTLKLILNSIEDKTLQAELSIGIGRKIKADVKNVGIRFMAEKLYNLYDIEDLKPLATAKEEVSMYGSYKRKKIFFVLPYDSLFAEKIKSNLEANSWANTYLQMNISDRQLDLALSFFNIKKYIQYYKQRDQMGLVATANDMDAGLQYYQKENIALIKEWMQKDQDPKKFSEIYNDDESAKTETRKVRVMLANGIRYIVVEMPYSLLKDIKNLSKKAVGYSAIGAVKTIRFTVELIVPNAFRLLDLGIIAISPGVVTLLNAPPVVFKGAWYGGKKLVKLITIDLARRSVLLYSNLSTQLAAKPLSFADETDRIHQKKDLFGNPVGSCENIWH